MSSSEDECFSQAFDPLKVLYSKDAKTQPAGSFCLFDNIASLEGYFKRTGANLEVKLDKNAKIAPLPKSTPIPEGMTVTRRFLPHQEMIHRPRKTKARHERSVLTDMEKQTAGPLGQLQLWMSDRTRVKVLIRKNHGVRGSVTGVLRLFDKHWNLALTDVEEQYQRRKFKHSTELCSATTVTEQMALLRFIELGLEHPLKNATIKCVDKKRVEVRRRHDLLFIKGDQVVLVSKNLH